MNFKFLTVAAAAALFIGSSCSGPGEGKSIDELSNPTTADSLSYLFGQQYGLDFWNSARADSAMTTPQARKKYLDGVADGLRMAGKDESYIQGYILGLNLLGYKEGFVKEFGMEVNEKALLDGMAYAMRSDSAVNVSEAQQMFNMLMTRVSAEVDKKYLAEAEKNIAALAKQKGMTKMGEQLYGKISGQGSGETLKAGDQVELKMKLTDASGKEISVSMPTRVTVGRQLAGRPFGVALEHMKPGQQGLFVTSAFATFGHRTDSYNLTPDQPLLFTIDVTKLTGKEPDDAVAGGEGVPAAQAVREINNTQTAAAQKK